jgi:hypothetical protein
MSQSYTRHSVRTTPAPVPTLRLVPSRVAPKPDAECITEALEVSLAHARALGANATVAALEAAWRVWSVEAVKHSDAVKLGGVR